jgi:hypothetical protein
MQNLKTDNPDIRNTELIQTYYSGKEIPAKRDSVIPLRKSNFSSYRLPIAVFLASFLIIALLGLSYALIRRSLLPGKDITLTPVKHRGNTSFYDYRTIEKSPLIIPLGRENTSVALNLGRATDLEGTAISFLAKGETGGEKIAIILRDKDNLSNANQEDVILTPSLPKNRWQSFSIKFSQLNLPLDKSRISQIRFDISSKLTENRPRAKTYIKDISIE